MKGTLYTPVVTTRDAELKGFSFLKESTKKSIVPIFEITRSRRSKKNPIGDVKRSLEKALDAIGNGRFVLDVCGLESQSNAQVVALLDESNGFENWCKFLDDVPENAIPVLHLEEPFAKQNFEVQAKKVLSKFDCVALRVPTSYMQADEAIAALLKILPKGKSFVGFVDAGYVKETTKAGALARMTELLNFFVGTGVAYCAPLSSSFPSSVLDDGYGKDATGEFPIVEVEISNTLKDDPNLRSLNIVHGDYSLIHPQDFTGTVTNWVPRIDYPLERKVFYHRVRRPKGGYKKCAESVVGDGRYDPMKDVWGESQVLVAAFGVPPGKNPSFWISVRVNLHIERQVIRLRS